MTPTGWLIHEHFEKKLIMVNLDFEQKNLQCITGFIIMLITASKWHTHKRKNLDWNPIVTHKTIKSLLLMLVDEKPKWFWQPVFLSCPCQPYDYHHYFTKAVVKQTNKQVFLIDSRLKGRLHLLPAGFSSIDNHDDDRIEKNTVR